MPEQHWIDAKQQFGIVIGLAPHHHAVQFGDMGLTLIYRADTAIDCNRIGTEPLLQAIDARIIERRNIAVLFGRQAFQPRLAGMHHQMVTARRNHPIGQRVQSLFDILLVNPDPAFDGHRHLDHRFDRRDTITHQLRLAHQTGPEAAILHAVGRTADIEVDLVIAEIDADPCRPGQGLRVRAAELQGNRMFAGIKTQQALAVAMDDRPCRDHLAVKSRPPRQDAVESPTMAVGPIHHRGHAEPPDVGRKGR